MFLQGAYLVVKKLKKNIKEENVSPVLNKNKALFYVFFIVFLISLIVLFAIFKPFIYVLILGTILGFFFFPINIFLRKHIKNKEVVSLLLIFLVFVSIILFFFVLINSVFVEISSASNLIYSYDFEKIDDFLYSYFDITISSQSIIVPLVSDFINSLTSHIPNFINSLSEVVLGLFIMLFLLYYFFKDGEKILDNILELLPIAQSHKIQIFEESKKVLKGVMYGQVLIALMQGIIGGIGFFIFGFNNPVLWGLIIAILSFIPMLGTPIVWLPASIFQIIDGNLFSGIGLLLWGVFILLTVENIVKPKLIGKKTGLHPLLVLLSILGGLNLFGIIGMLIGPVVVAVCVLIIRFFNQEVLIDNK